MTLFTKYPLPGQLSGDIPLSLGLLDCLQTPVWVFDIEQERMRYANAAALRLWNAESLDALFQRDWSTSLSEASRRRLADYLSRFGHSETISEQWTFYPGGEAISVLCRCSGLCVEEGRTAMLVEGIRSETLADASSLRALEAVRHTPLMVSVFDGRGRWLIGNPATMEIRGGRPSFIDCFAEEALAKQLLGQLETHGKCTLDAVMRINGIERWHHINLCRANDPYTGEPMIVMGEVDITPSKDLEASQRLSRRHLEVVIESLDLGVLLEDERRRVIIANEAFCKIFGIEAPTEALVGMDCMEAAHASKSSFREPERFIERIDELIVGKTRHTREVLELMDGRFLERSYTPVFVGDEYHGHLWVYRDITHQTRQQADWVHKASTDSLTGLANRRAFDENARKLARQVKDGKSQASLVMIDIDHFKAINDTLGHAEGDKGLRLLADTLRDNLRDSDLPCRVGGEEFMVIMPDLSVEYAASAANRLLEAIAERSRQAEDLPYHFTVSIGVTPFSADDASVDAVTRRADAAMYRAKHEGRNRVVVLLP